MSDIANKCIEITYSNISVPSLDIHYCMAYSIKLNVIRMTGNGLENVYIVAISNSPKFIYIPFKG